MACVKRVAVLLPESATLLAVPLTAGPAGLPEPVAVPELSPDCREIRVVFGVQFAAPTQVSRTKTWR